MSRSASLLLILALAVAPEVVPAGQIPPAIDPDIETGVHLTREGDFENAVPILDAAVTRLAGRPGSAKLVARANVYLAVAHRGLGQETRARTRIFEALRADPGLAVSTQEFPPAFVAFFEEARKDSAVAPSPVASPSPRATKGPRTALIVGGAVVAAGTGVVLATSLGKDTASPPPTSLPPSAPVEVLTIPVDGGVVFSKSILERGVTYTLRASGSATIGGAGFGDAEYNFNPSSSEVVDLCSSAAVDIGIGVNDMVNSGRKNPSWGPYNPAHVYAVPLIGQGAAVSFNFHDCAYGDNSGSLTVEIIR
jgi:hypothetical protein